jgi:hypothetical protein
LFAGTIDIICEIECNIKNKKAMEVFLTPNINVFCAFFSVISNRFFHAAQFISSRQSNFCSD